jgi:NADH:ubiquinone oxidoreductase subunit E
MIRLSHSAISKNVIYSNFQNEFIRPISVQVMWCRRERYDALLHCLHCVQKRALWCTITLFALCAEESVMMHYYIVCIVCRRERYDALLHCLHCVQKRALWCTITLFALCAEESVMMHYYTVCIVYLPLLPFIGGVVLVYIRWPGTRFIKAFGRQISS